jgi:hypothetical protein
VGLNVVVVTVVGWSGRFAFAVSLALNSSLLRTDSQVKPETLTFYYNKYIFIIDYLNLLHKSFRRFLNFLKNL